MCLNQAEVQRGVLETGQEHNPHLTLGLITWYLPQRVEEGVCVRALQKHSGGVARGDVAVGVQKVVGAGGKQEPGALLPAADPLTLASHPPRLFL